MDSQAAYIERLKQQRDQKREELYRKTPQFAFEQWYRENSNALPFDGGEMLRAKAREIGITEDDALRLSNKVSEAQAQQFESWFRENPKADDAAIRAKSAEVGLNDDAFFSIVTEVTEEIACNFTGREEEFRKRLNHISDEGWLFDTNAADVGLTLEQAIAVTRRWSTITGSRVVARFKDLEEALFFDPEDDFYKSLDHTWDFGWSFTRQMEMMGVPQEYAAAAQNRWLKAQGY